MSSNGNVNGNGRTYSDSNSIDDLNIYNHNDSDNTTKKGASVSASAVNILTFIVGGCVLPMPYAFKCAGIIGGTFILLLVWWLNARISYLIIDCIRLTGCSNYEQLVQMVLGRRARRILDISMILLLIGGLVGGMVVVQDLAVRIAEFAGIEHTFGSYSDIIWAAIAGAICLPLASLRRLDALAWTNAFSALTLCGVTCCVVYASLAAGSPAINNESIGRLLAPFGEKTLLAFPIFSFSFFYTPVLFPIYSEMENKNEFPKAMRWACLSAFTIYSIFGIFGFLQFGSDTKSDLLLSYTSSAPLTFAMTLATYINTIAAYPVSHYTLRFIIVELFTGDGPDSPNYSTYRHVIVAFIVLILVTLGAFVIPNIATVFSLTGATCVCVVCFIFPTLVYLRLHSTRFINTLSDVSRAAAVAGVTSAIRSPVVVSVTSHDVNGAHVTTNGHSSSWSAGNTNVPTKSHHHNDGDDALTPLIGAVIQPLSTRHIYAIWTILAIGVICSALSLIVIIPALGGGTSHD